LFFFLFFFFFFFFFFFLFFFSFFFRYPFSSFLLFSFSFLSFFFVFLSFSFLFFQFFLFLFLFFFFIFFFFFFAVYNRSCFGHDCPSPGNGFLETFVPFFRVRAVLIVPPRKTVASGPFLLYYRTWLRSFPASAQPSCAWAFFPTVYDLYILLLRTPSPCFLPTDGFILSGAHFTPVLPPRPPHFPPQFL